MTELKKIKFEEPVSLSVLEKILDDATKELKLCTQWSVSYARKLEKSPENNEMSMQVEGGHINGFIFQNLDVVANVNAYSWNGFFDKQPMFAEIRFNSVDTELGKMWYEQNIDKVYQVFQDKCKSVIKVEPKQVF